VSRPRRIAVVGVSLIAACLLLLSVEAGRWWSIGDAVTIGPVSSTSCFGSPTDDPGGSDPAALGDCKKGGLGWTQGSALWQKAGMATYAAGLIAAFVLVVLAAGIAAGRPGRLAAGTAVVGAITMTAMGALFIVTYPGLQGSAIDRGVWLFAGGVVAAVAAAGIVLASNRRGGATPVPT
jgi:hypothetical protein